jgi:protein-tyrosine-phosphatase
VLFVCEHGNVKSLMAMSYFNQLAHERGLPLVAISRGTALDSDTVPKAIVDGLYADGLDVSDFRPVEVGISDLNSARRVVAIGVALPAEMSAPVGSLERWDDVPPASVDFEASSQAIRARVQALIDELTP